MTKLEPTQTSSDLTATERFRELLDERGVKYKAWDGGTHPITVWYVDGQAFEFVEYRLINGAKQVSNNPWDNDGHCMLTITNRHCTPEQAIAATLGPGTCHVASSIIDTYEYNRWEYELSCGHTIIWEDSEPPNYCPGCGRKVVDA